MDFVVNRICAQSVCSRDRLHWGNGAGRVYFFVIFIKSSDVCATFAISL